MEEIEEERDDRPFSDGADSRGADPTLSLLSLAA